MADTDWHKLDVKEVFRRVGSSGNGLAGKEAGKRLEKFGPNELRKGKEINPLGIFLNQFRNFLVIILVVAAVFAFAIEEVLNGGVILVIVVLNAILGFVQEFRAGKAIEALKKLTSPETIVLRDGKKRKIPSSMLVPGDVVFLEDGTKIPADMRLIEAANLRVDEASLTGESAPVGKVIGAIGKAILADRKNMAFAGTHVTYGRGMGIVTATGMETEIGKIAHLIEETEEGETPLQKRLRVFGKNLGIIILIICGVVVAGGILRSYPPDQGTIFGLVLTGIALAVAAIPEGLPAVVTITLALGLQRLSKKNALIRSLPAVETLGSTSVICADKTGTLTRNEMVVRKVWADGELAEVTGKGYSVKGNFYSGKKRVVPGDGLKLLLRIGGLCNNSSLEKGKLMGDPTEGAVLAAALKGGLKLGEKRVGEIPFSSERKMMSTVNLVDRKQVMHTKGAVEVVLDKCSKIMRDGKILELDKKMKKEILETCHSLAGEALRVLGFAYKEIGAGDANKTKEEGLVFVGMMGMIDPPRAEVKRDVFVCKRAGIRVVMITGDHKNTAVAVAKEVGILGEKDLVLTGEELDKMEENDFKKSAGRVSVYARVNPSHKARIVDALKGKGEIVAMTGDGVNDAPALKKADIGVAMGIKGTDVSKEASDMILTDDNFSSIVSAVEGGRGIYDNINHFIRYLLSSNISEVLIIFLALMLFSSPDGGQLLIPLLAVQILWVNLATDGLPALALGVDPAARGIMSRMPRPKTEKLLSRKAVNFILWVGVIITIGTLWVFYSELGNGLAKAQTMAFTTLVVFELFNVFNVRTGSFLSNKKLLLAVLASLVLQFLVLYLPQLQAAFGTVALGPWDWIKIAGVSVTVLIIMQVKNRIRR